MGPPDLGVVETGFTSEQAEQPFDESAMGDSDLLPELSVETWVAATHLDGPPVTCLRMIRNLI